MKILSTKQLEDSLIGKTSENGIELTCIDVIETTPLDFDLAILSADRFDTIVFTSANAVKGFFKNEHSKDAIAPLHIYAISGKTNNELRQHGVYIGAVAPGSTELADMIIADKRAKSVLHICGDLRMDTLGVKLKEANVVYTPLVIYYTEMLYPTVGEEYDAILFFSPSGIDSYRKNNKLDPKVLYCCIGSTTGAHLSSLLGGAEVIVVDSPDPGKMIDAIVQHRK